MVNFDIIFYDNDIEYITTLNEYLTGKYQDYHFIYFTDNRTFVEFCKSFAGAGVFVIAEYCMMSELSDYIKGEILLLADEQNIVSVDNYNVLYRYQAVEHMISQILDYYAEKVTFYYNRKYQIKNDYQIIGIYSPVNRCGKTRVSIDLAKQLKEKVLVINLEEFSEITDLLHMESMYNISDLIYFFLKNAENLSIKLDAVVQEYSGFYLLPPVENPEDLYDIEIELWVNFILGISNLGKFRYIILDISNVIRHFIKILEICSYVFIPYINDVSALNKIEKMERYISKKADGNVMNKLHKVNMTDRQNADIVSDILKIVEE